MSLLDPYEAVKIFFLKNCEKIRSLHINAPENSLAYVKIPKFSPEIYLEENIRSMIDSNDDRSILEFFRVITCLAYGGAMELEFLHLDELIKSKFELSILSLLVKSPIEDLEDRFKFRVFELLQENELYKWMISPNADVSESLKSKENIVSFVAYFSFIGKFSSESLNSIKTLDSWNFIKTAEFLMNFAKDSFECLDEFFSFCCEVSMLCKIEYNFLEEHILNCLIDNICSWHTLENVLNLANHIKFEESTIQKLCQIIHESFNWEKDAVLKFFLSGKEVLTESYRCIISNYYANRNDRVSIVMVNRIFEALQIYTTDIDKRSANIIFEDIRLDEFIKTKGVLDSFIRPIEDIINTQLTRPDCWYDLLDAYFEKLPDLEDKSLERAKSHIPMLTLYLCLDPSNRQQESKKVQITNYLASFISQFENQKGWKNDDILNFFKVTFAFMPEIQNHFHNFLENNLLPNWMQKKKSLKEKYSSVPSNLYDESREDEKILIRVAILLAKRILAFKINSEAQFNYLAVTEFEDFINSYISIIREKDIKSLFSFYRDIGKYLEAFNFNKIAYEDSKNRITIAQFFIGLIKNSLTEVFKEYANRLKKKQQELEESKNKIPLDFIESEKETLGKAKDYDTMVKISAEESKFQECSDEENLNWMIESGLDGYKQIIGDSFWNEFWASKDVQANYIEEFRNSFLHKMVFSNDDENFVLRQYLASHLTRLFNGTLEKWNASFFTEGKQRAIKLYFNRPVGLNITQTYELNEILFSIPVKGVLSEENIWNQNNNLVKRTYFADLPDNISGITVFGGTILLHQSLSQCDDFKSCARKITFIHEAAHALRKYNEGSYNPEKKTPKSTKTPLRSGMPGSTEFMSDLREHDKNEGGKIIENAIFGAFFTKINKSQIDYINRLENWNQTIYKFKFDIAEKGKEVSKTYELARGSHFISSIRNDDCEHY